VEKWREVFPLFNQDGGWLLIWTRSSPPGSKTSGTGAGIPGASHRKNARITRVNSRDYIMEQMECWMQRNKIKWCEENGQLQNKGMCRYEWTSKI
jgi:hypothetical protein